MNAVVDGFDVASGRTSGSVRYAYTRQANPTAGTPATTFSISLITDDDLETLARRRLVVDGMAVHDGKCRGFHDAFALPLGKALPRVTRAGRVEGHSVGADAFSIRRRE